MQGKGNPADNAFHGSQLGNMAAVSAEKALHREVSYTFYPHRHPFVGKLIQALIDGSVRGLQSEDDHYVMKSDGTWVMLPDDGGPRPVHYEQIFSPAKYAPTSAVSKPWPVKDLDFTSAGAYCRSTTGSSSSTCRSPSRST